MNKLLTVNNLRKFFLLGFCLIGYSAFAQQPTRIGSNIEGGGGYTTYALADQGAVRSVRVQAGGTYGAGDRVWEFYTGDYFHNWRPYTSGLTLSGYDARISPVGGTASALYNSGYGGQSGRLPAISNGRYYTFIIGEATTANNFMSVLETTFNPVSFTSITQSPGGITGAPGVYNVAPSTAVTVTVNTSAAPASGENVYVRYTTDGFASSTFVAVSFVGSVGTATIPAQSAGTNVSYYVLSTESGAPDPATIDYLTLVFGNNSTANYSYSVVNPTATVAGSWSNSATWNTGQVPASGSIVSIGANVDLDVNATVNSITLNSGTLTDGAPANTLSINAGGSFNKGAGGFNAGTGTVAFLGSGTVTGGAFSFYNASVAGGLVNFGGNATITNNFTILSGGGAVTNRPLYGPASTLVYSAGGNYFSNVEWEGTFGFGDARPFNVLVTGGTDLVLDNGFTFESRNNLTIDAGSSMRVDATAEDLGVFGNFLNNGDVTLSTVTGDDLFVRGNWTNNGNFDSNNRAVFFDQGNTQTISGSSDIDFVVVSKSGGSITLQSGATLNIIQGLTTTSNLTVAGGGNLTLLSDATTTAWLDNFSGTGNVSGNLTIERFIPAGPTGFRFMSSPLSGASLDGDLSEVSPSGSGQIVPLPTCDGTQTAPGGPYGNIMQLVENPPVNLVAGCTQDNWFVVSSGAMTPGRGYAVNVTGSSVIDISGTAPTGTVSYSSLTNSGGDGNGIHLVGNPFPSPMEWNGVTGFDGAAYIFEAAGTYTGTFNDRLVAENYVIPSMQGFQVRVSSAPANFSVGNADRTTSAGGTFYRTESWYDQMLVLDVAGNDFMDKTRVYFTEGATSAFEPVDFDAYKLTSNPNQPTLFTLIDGEMIGTNGQAPLAEGPRVIPMGLKPGQNGTFTISVNTVEGFPASARILLEDLTTGAVQDLVQNPSYTFTMTTGEAAERFLLHFVPGADINAIAAECDGSNGQLNVDLGTYTVGTSVIGWDSYRLQTPAGGVLASGVPTSSSLSFSGLNAGEYQLVLASGSYEATEALRIEQPLTATAGFEATGSEFYAGEPLQLLDRSEGSAEYRYDFGDGNILTGEASPAYTYAEAGNYLVSQEVWSADGCADQITQSINVMSRVSSGLNASVNSMIVWTQGLQAFVNVTELQPGAQLVLSDVLGRQIAQTACNQAPCNVTAPAPGAYILSLESDQEISSRQIILQQ